MTTRFAHPLLTLMLGGCIMPPSDAGETLGTEGSTTDDGATSSVPADSGSSATDSNPMDSSGSADSGTGKPQDCTPGLIQTGCTNQLDIVIVVDNSAGMADAQRELGRSMPRLVDQLTDLTERSGLYPLDLDVQVMVTTTDLSSALCEAFEPEGYSPAMGSPIATPCTERLDDFTGLNPSQPVVVPETCTAICPSGVAPTEDFVAFGPTGTNVPDVPGVDIDGDGVSDPPVAQALACLVPQGINGCGYESPLEAMLQAINPEAPWNMGPRPFLRDDAALAIMLVSDEPDCSIWNQEILANPLYQNINPETAAPQASSAACWNMGVECEDLDNDGIYESCESAQNYGMHPTSRYIQYLDYLRDDLGKDVFMMEVTGVPPVIAHNPEAPFLPISGGVHDLLYRDWVDLPYPSGDIDPQEWAQGIRASNKQFELGIGPGCTVEDDQGAFQQATPPVRMLEVCDSLNFGDPEFGSRCCVESVCDHRLSTSYACLTGMLMPPGEPLGPFPSG
ncbi:MAG: hypothetical protein AAGF11_00295 [Myxococcota bacterium]